MLEQAIMEHFRSVHNFIPGPSSPTSFPSIKISISMIITMAKNVSLGKAIVFDGVDDSLFNFCQACCDTALGTSLCPECVRRTAVMMELIDPLYWEHERSSRHFDCRLICLNKKHPDIPLVEEYRPLVVCSPVVKFL